MKLPVFFEENFKNLMDEEEFKAFIASFDGRKNYGLRVNTLKISTEKLLDLINIKPDPILWER